MNVTKLHTTPTGHILYIEIAAEPDIGAWRVLDDMDGVRVTIGNGISQEKSVAAAALAACEFCRRYDATEDVVLQSLASMDRPEEPLTVGTMRKRFAPLLDIFPQLPGPKKHQ